MKQCSFPIAVHLTCMYIQCMQKLFQLNGQGLILKSLQIHSKLLTVVLGESQIKRMDGDLLSSQLQGDGTAEFPTHGLTT